MVENPAADYSITFFVRESGSAVFLAASEQIIDRENASWIGSTITCTRQPDLEKKFGPLVEKIATWLHEQDYLGPAGVDLLQTQDGDFQIVDLNMRTSGSLSSPLLRTHFISRGLQCASSVSITVQVSRHECFRRWRAELESGQMCILAWYEDGYAEKSFGDVVVGAEDEVRLEGILNRVREVSEQVTF